MYSFNIKMYDLENNCQTETNCLYFRFVKDVYTPYVYFEAKFLSSVFDVRKYSRLEFRIVSTLMHVGRIDSIDVKRKDNKCIVTVKSKGFTSLLCQNQPTPGMLTDIDLGGIIALCPDIPYISYKNSDVENYMYIKEGSTIWDAICNLAYRQTGIHPYIIDTNTVRITKKEPSREFTLTEPIILETGVIHDSTRIISDIHMQDTEGNYDVYSKKNTAAAERNIVRHKQIPLDYQFLSDPEKALDYRFAYSMRGSVCNYVRYVGFHFQDLFDIVNYPGFTGKPIHRLELMFDGSNLMTTVGIYNDSFFKG